MKPDKRSPGKRERRKPNNIQRLRGHALLMREKEVHLREKSVALLERAISDAQILTVTQEDNNFLLREANEHLVITSIEWHIMNERLEKSKAEMTHLANHDFLTDLPNRMQLYDRISQTIAAAKRYGNKLAILFLDLDRFKAVNDSFGHVVGDQLLQAVAQRLKTAVRASDTVSRQGGDEFVLLLPEVGDQDTLVPMIEKIHAVISAPYNIAGNELDVGTTIGISIFPEDGEDVETLIRSADAAMYNAKQNGRNTYQFFKDEMRGRDRKMQEIEAGLYHALMHRQFVLFYQAQINLENGGITGIEALIRWHHPERGFISPCSFIQDAEDCGAIVAIGRWVLLEACIQAQTWLNAGLAFDMIAVNVSAREFENNDFLENVYSVLQQSGMAPHRLELELTETVLMKNTKSTAAILHALRAIGVRIAIDDFGTGYSSLSYLMQFPIDTMKIDRSFIQGISSGEGAILVKAIIGIGKSLGHQVIAEGVETAEQLAILYENNCSTAQGFYLNKPMNAKEFAVFLNGGVAAHLLSQQCMPDDPSEIMKEAHDGRPDKIP